jgi:hypothetical protein
VVDADSDRVGGSRHSDRRRAARQHDARASHLSSAARARALRTGAELLRRLRRIRERYRLRAGCLSRDFGLDHRRRAARCLGESADVER